MSMPNYSWLSRGLIKPHEADGEAFAYGAWERFKASRDKTDPGWEKRLTGADFAAFLDAVYDQFQESRKH